MHWGSSSSLGLMNDGEKIGTTLRTSTLFHLGKASGGAVCRDDSTKSSYHGL